MYNRIQALGHVVLGLCARESRQGCRATLNPQQKYIGIILRLQGGRRC